jgi:hypothetical protein
MTLDRHPNRQQIPAPITKGVPILPAVVTRNSDDYATLRPNLIDSRASTVCTLPRRFDGNTCPEPRPSQGFVSRARFREAHFVKTRRNLVPI